MGKEVKVKKSKVKSVSIVLSSVSNTYKDVFNGCANMIKLDEVNKSQEMRYFNCFLPLQEARGRS